MVLWFKSLWSRSSKLSEQNVEELERLENEIKELQQQVSFKLEHLAVVSRSYTVLLILLCSLMFVAILLANVSSHASLFKRLTWSCVAVSIIMYILRRLYSWLVWYAIKRLRVKMAKLKTRKVQHLEDLKKKSEFYKVFDILKRFDETYKDHNDLSPTSANSAQQGVEATSGSSGTKSETPQSRQVKNIVGQASQTSSTIMSASTSREVKGSSGAGRIGITSCNKDNLIVLDANKKAVVEEQTRKGALLSFLQGWSSYLIQLVVCGLSGEQNLYFEEQLETLRGSLEQERSRRKKLEYELERILSSREISCQSTADDKNVESCDIKDNKKSTSLLISNDGTTENDSPSIEKTSNGERSRMTRKLRSNSATS